MDARAVAGLAVGIHRPPVPDRLQRLDARLDHLPARLAVLRHHEPHAAGGMLVLGAVEPLGLETREIGFLAGHPVGIETGHGASPSTVALRAAYSAAVCLG